MPVDVDAEVLSNTRLSGGLLRHRAARRRNWRPRIKPGQFVMVRAGQVRGAAAPPALLDLRPAARRRRRARRLHDPQQAGGRRQRAALRRARPATRFCCLGPLGRPFTVVVAADGGVDGRRGRGPRAVRDADRSAARRAGTAMRLFYGARSASDLFCLDRFEPLRRRASRSPPRTAAGASAGASSVPLERELARSPRRRRSCSTRAARKPCWRPSAGSPTRFGQPSELAMERQMGCGMGGCYSCVVRVRTPEGGSRYARSCIEGPVFKGRATCCGTDMDLSVQVGSLRLQEPPHVGERLLRLRPRVRATWWTSPRSGAVVVKGLFLNEREGHPPPRIVETPAGMLNAIGLQGIGVHRFVREKMPELRARRATVIVNVCGTTVDEYVEVSRILSDAEGRRRHRAEHLLPEHQGGRHHSSAATSPTQARWSSAVRKATHPAADPEADAQRDRRRLVRAGVRGGRGRRGVARQHVPGDGDRRRDPAAEAVQRHGRAQRPGHSPDRGAHGVRVRAAR